MAIKKFNIEWLGVYRASSNSYYGGSQIRVGSSSDYQSFIGIPPEVREAIKTSRTTPKLRFNFNVTDGAEFDVGAHKETSNKGFGTMPYYNYIGLHPQFGTGWREIDLTADFLPEYKAGTRQGIVLYGGSEYGTADGNTNNSNEAYFEVEGTWNQPPSSPTFKTPASSTIASDTVLVSWNPATDPEKASSALTYQLRYFDGTKIAQTLTLGAGVTSYSYRVDNRPETSKAYFEVRAFDGEDYSAWRKSQVFTVAHNLAPSKPTQLAPSGGKIIDRAEPLRVSWRHNDDGAQAGYQVAWRTIGPNGEQGTFVHAPSYTSYANSTSQYHTYPANTFPLGEIEWNVRTKDQKGLESPWSERQRFIVGEASTAPIFLSPDSGAVLNTSQIEVEWSSLDQIKYEIEVLENGSRVWFEAGTTAKRTDVEYPLKNGMTYSIKLRVISAQDGLWSPWSTETVTTQFIAPAIPTLALENDFNSGTIILTWNEGTPATATVPVSADVLRREYNDSLPQEFQVVAAGLLPNDTWIDYTPASDQTYEYRVRVWGPNETSTDSAVVEGEILFDHAFLHRAYVLSDVLLINVGDSREQEFEFSGEAMFFSNRKLPVYEHGFTEKNQLDIGFIVDSPDELRGVISFIKRRETFLYRDSSGRRFYCVALQPKIVDLPVKGFEFSMKLLEVDYIEEGR